MLWQALDGQAVEVAEWEMSALHGGMEWLSAVYRLQGTAQVAGKSIPWSVILKVIRPSAEDTDPQGAYYWRREALVYQSGRLQRLPGALVAPRCYAVQEQEDGSLWLWLEDLRDQIGASWLLEHCGHVARHLGQVSGAYLVGYPLPNEPWIPDHWLERYVERATPMVELVRHKPDHAVVRSLYPGNSRPQILALWEERGHVFDALRGLPQVLCHQDAFRRNLFACVDQTAAIDWGYSAAPC